MKSGEKFVQESLTIGAIELVSEGRKLKSGRISPYFFNAGLFSTGTTLFLLADAYVDAMIDMDWRIKFDAIFGPAYKGIPLAVAVSIGLSEGQNLNVGWAFNRKEAKDHAEGGIIVGSKIEGKDVLIVDDVMTTGSSCDEAVAIVKANGGIPVGCVIAFDRQEKGVDTDLSAVQEFERKHDIPVRAAATLNDLIEVLRTNRSLGDPNGRILPEILKYREQYGV